MTVLITAIIFTIGCLFLVTNAGLSFLPVVGFGSFLPRWIIYVEGILSVSSCGLFLAGSIISFREALKATAGDGGYFGWELEDHAVNDTKESAAEKGHLNERTDEVLPPYHAHCHHQNNSHTQLIPHLGLHGEDLPQTSPPPYTELPIWSHKPTARRFRHKLCNLGLIASVIFLISSVVYCLTALASLITILSIGEVFRGIRWPQLGGGFGFVIGSVLLLLKAQKDTTGCWWKPAYRRLAWYVNLLNLIGSAGFVICASFGLLAPVHWTDFQFNCSYLWGSWAFLFGSGIQWFKARHKANFPYAQRLVAKTMTTIDLKKTKKKDRPSR